GLSRGRDLGGADCQGREAGRPAGHAVHQDRVRAQPHDRQNARPHGDAVAARHRRRGDRMRRREFTALLVGATAAWPFMSRAQGRTARVGVLMVVAETDPESERLARAFEKGLEEAGWHKGRNLQLTYRWSASNPDLLSRYAEELVRAAPDILLAFGTAELIPLHKATTTIPIVFASVSNPVG